MLRERTAQSIYLSVEREPEIEKPYVVVDSGNHIQTCKNINTHFATQAATKMYCSRLMH